jgi:hypothetical protein
MIVSDQIWYDSHVFKNLATAGERCFENLAPGSVKESVGGRRGDVSTQRERERDGDWGRCQRGAECHAFVEVQEKTHPKLRDARIARDRS